MDKILKLKLIILFFYGVGAVIFFHNEYFLENSYFFQHPHQYGYGAFIVTIFSLGVIFSAMAYNFAFYFYIRNRQYLYYALTQFFVLLSLIAIESLLIHPFTEIYAFQSFYLLDISKTLMLIFSLLFIQEFFQTDNSRVDKSIKIVIYMALFDVLISLFLGYTLLTKFIPTTIWIWFILSEVYKETKVKDVPFYSIMIGWHIVIITLILELVYIIDPREVDFPFLHLAFAFESILLSFALSYKFKLIEDEQKRQQSLLLQQSRLASMGEMVSVIAHQWRQPLTFLSYSFMHIKQECQEHPAIAKTIEDGNLQLQYMSKTIENFRNFYNPSKEKALFKIEEASQNSLNIIKPQLENYNIEVELTVKDGFSFYGNNNEFQQVILNLLNNAKDVLIERKVHNPKIEIIIENPTVTVKDNGGGILTETQEKIFDPYFTTKEGNDGIGLYIAKIIIEKEMKGVLSFKSNEESTSFIIEFITYQ